jgi:hypothetical protein
MPNLAAMGEVDAIGDAITGGMLGRAAEPKAGERHGHTHETTCLNCGAELTGPYCSECGQHAHVHRTLAAFFHDFAHGVLHFEGKIWRTVPIRLVPGRPHPPLHRRPARTLRLAHRLVPVLRVPDVRRGRADQQYQAGDGQGLGRCGTGAHSGPAEARRTPASAGEFKRAGRNRAR